MSKQIKQMEMDALEADLQGRPRPGGAELQRASTSQADNQMRLTLRKKNIRLQMVKNSLARRVFSELGIQTDRRSGKARRPSPGAATASPS